MKLRNRVISASRVSQEELNKIKAETNYPTADEADIKRPKYRSECGTERPCPFVSCRCHLYLDVNRSGGIILNTVGMEPWEMKHSCALDLADNGTYTLAYISQLFGLTRERIRQIEVKALKKIKRLKDLKYIDFKGAA